ncbi:DNA-binding domain-containing protein [Maricaulis sp.]|uniref:DNA-binding domain-containing protein n=1 Tax=Maricaulis sp. TaxID=1486257 RepID=UPI002B26F033|nr:DNA-binding domain-containing protein [Maricaulis sp.]
MPDCFYSDFAVMLRGGAASGAWSSHPDIAARCAIYRNNVVNSAIEALRAAYPTVNKLTGDRFFSPMAKAHWQNNPPQTRTMTLYGAGFAAHVRDYAPASTLPYLADIARLDRAWLEAMHAPDAVPCWARTVAAMAPQELPNLAPGLHPSVRVLHLDWPVHAVWSAHRFGQPAGETRLAPQAEAVILYRPQTDVFSARLTAADAIFLDRLGAGASLSTASAAALVEDPFFDAAKAFGDALTAGYLAGDLT